jgi:hypothetical protein
MGTNIEDKESEIQEAQEALVKKIASIKHLLMPQEIIKCLKKVETDILIRLLEEHRTKYKEDLKEKYERIKCVCLLGLSERDELEAKKAIFEAAYLDRNKTKEMASGLVKKDVESFSSLIKEYLSSK